MRKSRAKLPSFDETPKPVSRQRHPAAGPGSGGGLFRVCPAPPGVFLQANRKTLCKNFLTHAHASRAPRPGRPTHERIPRCHSKTMTWTSQSSADATDRAGSTADVACKTSCSSLWSLLLGHAWLSSCYRLICRVLYYPNRGAEVRALLTDAQRARVLTLAVVDLSFALSMLPQQP